MEQLSYSSSSPPACLSAHFPSPQCPMPHAQCPMPQSPFPTNA
ncbi:MAG: hypothetical protein V7K68_30690 [Nostoc sp.]